MLNVIKSSVLSCLMPESLLVSKPGRSPARVLAYSHYSEPIRASTEQIHGRSRNWGDISLGSQRIVVYSVIEQGLRAGLSIEDISLALAIARVESGFNPDAASGTTSASGLAQFIDRTGQAYGLSNENRFSIAANARALIAHLVDLKKYTARHFSKLVGYDYFAQIYALYHDGPSLAYGGLKLARSLVIPWMDRFLAYFRSLVH